MADNDRIYDNTTTATNTAYDADLENDDNIQHGIDDSPTGDAEKGATLGGVGGAVTGAIAGAMAGPVGAVAGAIIGGVAGAVASGAAVAAVDRHDNDNTISGVGSGATTDINGPNYVDNTTYNTTGTVGNGVPGVQTGGHDIDGTPDTRGIWEKTADTVTGDRIDDKTGKPVASDTFRSDMNAVGNDIRGDYNAARTDVNSATYGARAAADSGIGTGVSREAGLGETMPSLKTGGVANDGTPDTRGIGEKTVDALTGDVVDDKTGRVVDHP